jgi:hypothetical protein
VLVVLFSQLLLLAIGGPFVVICEAAGGHEMVELAHSTPCDDSEATYSNRESYDAHESLQFATEYCVDTPVTQPPVLRQDDRPVFQPIPAVIAYFSIFDAVEVSLRIPQALAYVFSPDSPESLARSVILLI